LRFRIIEGVITTEEFSEEMLRALVDKGILGV
jgi:hypothetical protein